jgi:small-conductance mechanosensitive channel
MRAFVHDIFDPAKPWGAFALAVVVLAIAVCVARSLKLWTQRLVVRSHGMVDATAVVYFSQLAQVVCFILALIIYAHMVPALQRLGDTVLASAGLVSLVIGLAAQNTLGNLISGFSLLLYRPFGIGDVLTLNTPTGKETGTVREFTLGYTKLMTEDGRWIIIPNSLMASSIVIRVK